ncbi:restriction endonuclease subunit S [Treponema succinifaciens]|uniref:Restriction modification system DNA specificity domain protein n=1 Tax=Treponema succinifaciens (strain ATCC 33096 / DSM 2489 / 6091) TaxID=869209 RepID=F2NWW1_TRES6|nr:restriction endonuclease subunit S [Treponema succinifaciens]AEB13160.1 restriction modification system DNA specificity domain protein [Treponema succinifaciens DSM 2489]
MKVKYIKLKKIATYPTGKLNSNAAEKDGIYPFFTCSHDIYRINNYAYDGEYVLLGGNNATGDFPIFYYNGKFNAYQRTYLIQPIDTNQFDTRYLFYSIGLKLKLMQSNAAGTATRFLTQPILDNINIEYRPLPTQQKIASILSAYDDLIQNYKKQIEALQTAASELYKEWFVRFRFPGWQNAKFENGIPEGWSICRLKDFGKVITGKTPPTEKEEYYGGDVMFVKTPDMHGNMFVQSTSEYLSKLGCEYQKAQYLPENSIMVSCIGTGGITAINAYPANTNQQINSIILKDKKYLPWLYFTISNMKETIEMFGNTGTTMTNLSKGKFEKLKVVKPEHSIIQTFENKVSPLFEQIKNLNKQITNLTQQRDLLLPRLMSGKLEVLK